MSGHLLREYCPPKPERRCKRIKRDGNQCSNHAMKGKESCRFHGGKAAGKKGMNKGNKHAQKHGLYSKNFTDKERELIEKTDIESLEQEIAMMRIRLNRAVEAQEAFVNGELLIKKRKTTIDVMGDETQEVTEEARDFTAEINTISGRINNLVRTHTEIMKLKGGDKVDLVQDFLATAAMIND